MLCVNCYGYSAFVIELYKSVRKSSDILVEAPIIRVALHVLPLNELFDPLLDHHGIGIELLTEYLGGLSDEGVMFDLPARLHDLDNGRLDDVPPIFVDLVCDIRLLQILVLFGVRNGHLDLVHLVLEAAEVQRVQVGQVELLHTLRGVRRVRLHQDLQLKERNQVALQIHVTDVSEL